MGSGPIPDERYRLGDDSHVPAGELPARMLLVMFDEISSRPAPRSQQFYIYNFAAYFALFLVGSAIAWFCWPGVIGKIASGSFVLWSLTSGVFLLTAKSAHPRTNQDHFWALSNIGMIVPVILGILSDVLR
jgi:hypothetical protein